MLPGEAQWPFFRFVEHSAQVLTHYIQRHGKKETVTTNTPR